MDPGLEAARIDHPRVVWLPRVNLGCPINETTVEVRYIMRALDAEVVDAVFAAVGPRVPVPVDEHRTGGHRPRIPDKIVFWGILIRLVTGCSWVTAERLLGNAVSDTTMRARRGEWVAAGVFEDLESEALAAYDRIVGLDLSDASVDGSIHKAPCGGDGTGKSPVDRAKLGWKWSILTDRAGVPVAAACDGANRNDCTLLEPTLQAAPEGLLADMETLHLDRGYDNAPARAVCAAMGIGDVVCSKKRPRGRVRQQPRAVPLGMRWSVERTNSWLSNFGQLRPNTDRRPNHRRAQLSPAIALILTAKLIDHRDRCNPQPRSIRARSKQRQFV